MFRPAWFLCTGGLALSLLVVGCIADYSCPADKAVCRGVCVDTRDDPENCGTCGNQCDEGVACNSGVCANGQECPAGQTKCGTECLDLQTDPDNCGTCGNRCAEDKVCANGRCSGDCPSDYVRCGRSCVDLMSDENHCGVCNNTCHFYAECVYGACSCVAGYSDCDGVCVDLSTDPENCGSCSAWCPQGEDCVNGTCMHQDCPRGQVRCGRYCVDLMTDENNCGACGNMCGILAECVNGACACVAGYTDCNGVCIDLQWDANNCGSCGVFCASGEDCVRGACQGHGCTTNEDCPRGYWCDRTVWRCRPIECIPNCTGKCCGDDGCAGTCPNNCPAGYWCNWRTCTCESEGCQTDADCRTTQCCMYGICVEMNCGTLECGPDPVCGKECGPCPQGYHCDMGRCVQDITCTSDAHCMVTQCCINGTCVPMACGALECGPDPVCAKECGPCPQGEACVHGVCQPAAEFHCPPGQECVDMSGGGYYGCIIPPNTIPPGNQTGCDPANSIWCDGNYTCFAISEIDTICIENCGTCTGDLVCMELWPDGPWGCLAPGGGVPPGAPICDAGPCTGNATCYSVGGTSTACIDNCSVGYGCDTNGETKCLGDIVQTCTNGAWVDTTDCTTTNQVCSNGACVAPVGLGDFCENTPCAAGLDCIGFMGAAHYFCTPQCDCNIGTGCDVGWECLLSDAGNPPTCWCAKLCTTAADCPDGGAGGYECIVIANDGTNDIYGCIPE